MNRAQLFRLIRGGGGAPPDPSHLPQVAPSGVWTGEENSGFEGSPPTDNAQDALKPGAHLIVERSHWVQGEKIRLGARGGMWGGCTVTFELEGAVYPVQEARVAYPHPRGSPWSDPSATGYWVEIDPALWPSEVYGVACGYFRFTPHAEGAVDTVVGPIRLFRADPADAAFGRVISVDSAGGTTAGVTYPTILPALQYCRANNLKFARVVLKRSESYSILSTSASAPAGVGNNRTNTPIFIEPDAGVTSTIVGPTPNDFTYQDIRCGYGGLYFRGYGLIWDQCNLGTLVHEAADDYNRNVFAGIRFINSQGSFALWRGSTVGKSLAERAVFLDCDMTDLRGDKLASACLLARGNIIDGFPADIFTDANCAVGNIWKNCLNAGYTSRQASMTIKNTTGAAITVVRVGSGQGTPGATVDSTLTITIGGTPNNFTVVKAPGYNSVQAVTDWVNGLGLEAVNLHPDNWMTPQDRAAMWLSTLNSGAAGGPFSVTVDPGETLTLYTSFDIHMDFMQTTTAKYGCVFADNIGWNVSAQWFLAQSTASITRTVNWYVVNNTMYLSADAGALLTQLQYSVTNLMLAHNTIINQTASLRFNFGAGENSMAFANVFNSLTVESNCDGTWWVDNHLIGGVTGAGTAKPTQYSTGGTVGSLVEDAANGDFKPKAGGELRVTENLVDGTVVPFDALGNRRLSLDARGAISLAA